MTISWVNAEVTPKTRVTILLIIHSKYTLCQVHSLKSENFHSFSFTHKMTFDYDDHFIDVNSSDNLRNICIQSSISNQEYYKLGVVLCHMQLYQNENCKYKHIGTL